MKLAKLQNRNIAIWGFGVEGQATAAYLSLHKIDFKVLCQAHETDAQYHCITDEVDQKCLNAFDVIIKSPGISPYTDLVATCTAQFTSPTALWFANEKDCFVIAVTGTKGKSTTVSLLAHILKHSGKSVNLLGNIGQALISSSSNYDYIILEASSYQTYDGHIKADIALVNNLFPEHLDWHHGEENYYKDKLKILDGAVVKVINAANDKLKKCVTGEDVVYFNSKESFYVQDETLMYQQQSILKLYEINLIGVHNLQNIGAALTVCMQLQLEMQTCINAVKSFIPLPHRLQNLGKIGKHFVINDSIATTAEATLAAMQTQDLDRTTLLVGGFDRGNDWASFAKSIKHNPPYLLILSGANSQDIYQHLKDIEAKLDFILCDTLKDAIFQAQSRTPKNHTLLLSPGAPSFDQFSSYIKRGEFFVEELRKNVL